MSSSELCTCLEDFRTCKRHPYKFEGPNGVARPRDSVSPNTRLNVTIGELVLKKTSLCSIDDDEVTIMRKAVLMEDEGVAKFVKSCRRSEAVKWIASQKDQYFSPSDYYVL